MLRVTIFGLNWQDNIACCMLIIVTILLNSSLLSVFHTYRICQGVKNADNVLREQVAKYKEVFIEAARKVRKPLASGWVLIWVHQGLCFKFYISRLCGHQLCSATQALLQCQNGHRVNSRWCSQTLQNARGGGARGMMWTKNGSSL